MSIQDYEDPDDLVETALEQLDPECQKSLRRARKDWGIRTSLSQSSYKGDYHPCSFFPPLYAITLRPSFLSS